MKNLNKSFYMMIVSSFFGALIAVSMKTVSLQVSMIVIFFITRVFLLVGATPSMIKHKKSILESKNKLNIMWVSIFYIAALYCYFDSLTLIPMSLSSLFSNSVPLYVPLLSYFLLKDDAIKSKKLWGCILICFIGIGLILDPTRNVHYSLYGMLLAFLSGVLLAIWQVLTKKITAHESANCIAFYQMISSIVITAVPVILVIALHSSHYLSHLWTIKNISMLLLAGISSWMYQLYRTKAMHYASVSYTAPFAYFGVLFVSLFDWLFWNTLPQKTALIGMGLVIAGVVLLLRSSKKKDVDQYKMEFSKC